MLCLIATPLFDAGMFRGNQMSIPLCWDANKRALVDPVHGRPRIAVLPSRLVAALRFGFYGIAWGG